MMAHVNLPPHLTVPLPGPHLRTGSADRPRGGADGEILRGYSSDVRRSRESKYVPRSQSRPVLKP